ncbi:glycosyl transferase [Novosphingobium sp. MD-1]|nr:glycosyl transferase [Novosphingobium sp. MD-1]
MAEFPIGMTSEGPDISVVIPHYNDLARLALCLAALDAQTIARDRFEIIVADNASPVDPGVLAATIGTRARLVIATEKGAGPARNAGVAAARGAILAFTDCDCVPEASWLAAGVIALGRGDVVGGRMIVSVSSEAAMTGAEAFERVFAFDNRQYVEKKGFSVTANLLTRRAVFDKVGPFRNGVSEDVDWCHRARALGFALVYAPDAAVAHPARANWAELRRKWQRMNVEGFGLVAHDARGKLRWVARSLALPLSIVAHAPRVLVSRDLPDAGARLRALATLAGLRLWRMGHGIGLIFGGGHR